MANYFTRKELECKCCGQCLISDDLLGRLNQAREMAGIPFIITSGYRCQNHNDKVGGKPNSAHTTGQAVDIAFKNSNTDIFKASFYRPVDSRSRIAYQSGGVAQRFQYVWILF